MENLTYIYEKSVKLGMEICRNAYNKPVLMANGEIILFKT